MAILILAALGITAAAYGAASAAVAALWRRCGPDHANQPSDVSVVASGLAGTVASGLIVIGIAHLWPQYVPLWVAMMVVEWLVGFIMAFSAQDARGPAAHR